MIFITRPIPTVTKNKIMPTSAIPTTAPHRASVSTAASLRGSRLKIFLRRAIGSAATLAVLVTFSAVARPAQAQHAPGMVDALEADHARWHTQELGVVELPMGLRAHFNAQYTWHFYPSDQLASTFVGHAGPSLDKERSLVSRIAISHALTDNIDLEIAWGARNRLASSQDPMQFQRHTVGALIRITP